MINFTILQVISIFQKDKRINEDILFSLLPHVKINKWSENKLTKPLSFSAFVMDTASHINHGLWRHPEGSQIDFNDIDVWVELAKKLEAGGIR